TRPVEQNGGDFRRFNALGSGQRKNVLSRRRIKVNRSFRITWTNRDFVHVAVWRVQQRAGVGHGQGRNRARHIFGAKCRALERVDGDVDLRAPFGSYFFTDEQHGRFVHLALADHDRAIDQQFVELAAHGVHCRLVGRLILAMAAQTRGGHRGAFGNSYDLKAEDAFQHQFLLDGNTRHMTSITVQQELVLERILSLEIVRVTERAAVSSARLRGHGKDKASDQAAVDAMRRELNKLLIDGTVVIGEGEMDEAPMLFIGEKVGTKGGPKVDIAVDPLEGTTLCAKNMPGAIATLAMADAGTLLHAPDCYMDKIAIGPGYPKGTIDLDAPPTENILSLARAKGVKPSEITAILLDRPRHADIIAAVRKTGAAVSLISDGDVAGVIHCAEPKTGIDIYLGIG